MTTVLITGFGRFPGAPFNPSGPLARALAKRRRPAFADLHARRAYFRDQLCGGRSRPAEAARETQAGHRTDVRARGAHADRAHRDAQRAMRARSLFPDVTGHRPDARAIAPAQAPLRGPAPFARLLGAAARQRRTRAAFARRGALPLQLRLLARAGGVPIRHAACPVHPHPAGSANAAAPAEEAHRLAGGAGARRRGHSARTLAAHRD